MSAWAMPWWLTWKKPISTAALHSCSVISARRASKSLRSITRASRATVVPSVPMVDSLRSSSSAKSEGGGWW
jgi:hypothetical protein